MFFLCRWKQVIGYWFLILMLSSQDGWNIYFFVKVSIHPCWRYWSIFSLHSRLFFKGSAARPEWTSAASSHHVNYESANTRFSLMVMTCRINEMLTLWKFSSWSEVGRGGFNINDSSCWWVYLSVLWGSAHSLLISGGAETFWRKKRMSSESEEGHVLVYCQ